MTPTLARHTPTDLPDDFHWPQSVGLLLDATQVENLLPRLSEWCELPRVEVLYLTTPLAELRDLSPCLVRLKNAHDPVLEHFLANTQQQWGYLLTSDQPWGPIVAHLRWLTIIEHPSGQELLLRIAYPGVADALFGPTCPDNSLFGPIQQIFTPNTWHNGWHRHTRPAEMPKPNHAKRCRLSEAQWASLDEASLSKTVDELHQHMATYFPKYRNDLTALERREHLHNIARRGIEQGFESEKELYLYANAHGFIGEQTLHEDEYLSDALKPGPCATSSQRAERIAYYAQRSLP